MTYHNQCRKQTVNVEDGAAKPKRIHIINCATDYNQTPFIQSLSRAIPLEHSPISFIKIPSETLALHVLQNERCIEAFLTASGRPFCEVGATTVQGGTFWRLCLAQWSYDRRAVWKKQSFRYGGTGVQAHEQVQVHVKEYLELNSVTDQ